MNLSSIWASAAWTAAGWTMLHLVWIGAAGGLAATVLRRLLRPARPEVRHGMAVACLLAFTIAPVVLFAWLYRPDPATGLAPAKAGHIAITAGRAIAQADPPPSVDLRRPGLEPPVTAPISPITSRLELLVSYLPGVWLSGSLATLALIAAGLIGVEQLRRSSRPLESDAIARQCRVLAASLGVARRVGVAVCDRIAAPVLVGIVRPMILLPPAVLGCWSIEQLEMALLHELAHIRRHDNLVTLLQRLAESLLFFHPLTWWLSAWVSLERELCCDRLVVEHTGRPRAYARMLAALAGAGPGARSMALAMAERPLTTRIRRILDMEDRSMKMTLTEGLGLLAAAIVGTALTLAAHARPPEPVPDGEARRTLERLAERVLALPDGPDPYADKGIALLQIAQSQVKLGDRAAALATLRRLDKLAEPPPLKPGAKVDPHAWTRFAALAESAGLRREMGDRDGARAALERAARLLDVLDHGAVRGAIERVGKEMEEALAKQPEGLHRLSDEEAALISEASVVLIDQYIGLGDMAAARAQIHRLLEVVGPLQGPMKVAVIGALGGYLIKAGDPGGGRDLIEQSRRAALALPNPEARAFALRGLMRELSAAGDIDQELALAREVTPRAQQAILGEILDGLADDDHTGGWLDFGGVNIKIGTPSLRPKDPARARAALPKVATAVRASDDAKAQTRTLAIIAHLQARAGDIPGALATARSIPELKRSDFPGPSDGFYDAVKPVVFALIAGRQAEAGDRPGAAATLAEAEGLARAVAAEDQKLVAQIAIARKQTECGRPEAAKAIIAEATPLALTQPEPRRSRVLTMLAEAQAQAGDEAAALHTIDAIRNYPGLEKARALQVLARRREEAGDANVSNAMLRRAAACLESKAPAKPLPGPVMKLTAIGRDTFIDFDLELDPNMVPFQRSSMIEDIRIKLGDVAGAVRAARALPPPRRDYAVARVVGNLARRGDVAGAMDLAASIESPDARLNAFVAVTTAIPERRVKK
jgi:beta-lactamase regulating signal transducer with metallopeptidase domain